MEDCLFMRINQVDLHIHSTISDGTDSPDKILDRVRHTNIRLFSITDHDSCKATSIIQKSLTKMDPYFLSGIELSCKDTEGYYHILGYGFDHNANSIIHIINKAHQLRVEKAYQRICFLKDKFGFALPDFEINRILSLDNPGKPHIANLLVRYGYASSIKQAINTYIDHLHSCNWYITPEEAIDSIIRSGGISILAHPIFGNGNQLIVGEDLVQRIKRLKDYGLQGLEAYYSGFVCKHRLEVISLAEQYNMYITAGSDYHGTNKSVKLGDTGLNDSSKWPDGLKRFISDCLSPMIRD